MSYGQSEEKTFTAPKFGFSINYPPDWTVLVEEEDFSPPRTYDGPIVIPAASIADLCPSTEVGTEPEVLDCEDKSPVYVEIIVFRLKEDTSLKEFSDKHMSGLKSMKFFPRTDVDSNEIEISGLPAIQVIELVSSRFGELLGAENLDGKISKVMTVYVVNGNIGYKIFINADSDEYYEKYLTTFQKILNSIEILETSDVQGEKVDTNADQSIDTIKSNTSIINGSVSSSESWVTYESNDLPVHFAYPSDWEVEEKENRFETGPDLQVSDGMTRFFLILFNEKQNDLLDSYGLVETTKTLEGVTSEKEDYTIIEGTDMEKYRIDGKRTGTFLAKSDGELFEVAQQLFVVENQGKGYIFGFEGSTLTFDDAETQEIMNRILESIKFVI